MPRGTVTERKEVSVGERRRRNARGDAPRSRTTPHGQTSHSGIVEAGRGAPELPDYDAPRGESPTPSRATLGDTADRTAARTLAHTVPLAADAATSAQPTFRHDTGSDRAEAPSTLAVPTAAPEPTDAPVAAERAPMVRYPRTIGQNAQRHASMPSAVLIRGAAHPAHPATRIVPRRTGPRSPVTQFVGGMVVTVVLFTTFALGTPLGRTAGVGDAFQTYANALPWVPTPTPTPRPVAQVPTYAGPPHEANPGTQAIVDEISAVFGGYAQGALAVARCESGYDPNAWNPFPIGNSHASGVFQILYPSTWDGTAYASFSPFDANANIHAAFQLFSRDGNTWREWQCQP